MKRTKCFPGIVLALAIALVFSACSIFLNDSDAGNVSITIGSSSGSRTAAPAWLGVPELEDLAHTILVLDANGAERYKVNNLRYGETKSFSLAPGVYTFQAKAFYNGDLMAEGSVERTIRSGVNTAVIIPMGELPNLESTFTVTFNSNGGGTVPAQTVNPDEQAIRPTDPIWLGFTFDDWYSDSGLTTTYNFSTPITGNITLYARWDLIIPLTTTSTIDLYLAEYVIGGNTVDDPVYLPMEINLGNMTQASSGWRQLLEAIGAAGKFINLDLSACSMNGTEFNPDNTIATGKNMIVSMVVPDDSLSTALGNSSTTPIFRHFNFLKSIIGTNITTLGAYAFCNLTSLTEFELPMLTSISTDAFYGCTNLVMSSLPTGLISIGDYAFYNCNSLDLNSLPTGLISIGDRAFTNCTSLTLTSLPAGLTSIGESAFYGCTNLALTSLPTGLISVGSSAFSNCTSLSMISLPAGITSINMTVFNGCTNLVQISLPAGLISIDNSAFGNCTNLVLTSLPAELESIGYGAFSQCKSLTIITLPAELISIGEYAFYLCNNLVEVIMEGITPPSLGTNAFENTHTNLQIKVPMANVADYQTHPDWSAYASRIIGY